MGSVVRERAAGGVLTRGGATTEYSGVATARLATEPEGVQALLV